ncbi:hypothetical protein [Streptomyces sp. NPDC005438]|uniref:hypothetical protein n=1 Tax=Streptomyces sp. NPDC005438 TaxID=3156880 RepID=UPI0033BB995F
MLWWLRARRVTTYLSGALLAFTVLTVLLQDTVARLPSFLTGGDNPVVAMLLVPVPLYATLLLCLENRLPAEATAVRTVRLWDVGLALATVAAASLVGLVLGAVLDAPAALSLGRNTAFLCGLALCVRPLTGPAGVMVPVAWLTAVMLFGFRQGHPLFWTVLPREPGDPASLVAATVSLLVGLLALALHRPPTRT